MSKFFFPLFVVMCAAIWVSMKMNEATVAKEEAASLAREAERQANFRPEAPGPRAAVLKKRGDKHFWAEAKVDGVRVEFIVDTGATSVALTASDAQRIGYDLSELDFKWEVSTANGKTQGAYVVLGEVSIGNVDVENVGALVIRSELEQSLLGMSFLNELSAYEVRKSSMIIRE